MREGERLTIIASFFKEEMEKTNPRRAQDCVVAYRNESRVLGRWSQEVHDSESPTKKYRRNGLATV
jgi:hypothetical protein